MGRHAAWSPSKVIPSLDAFLGVTWCWLGKLAKTSASECVVLADAGIPSSWLYSMSRVHDGTSL
jgi:hypothetical protein